MQKNLSKGTGRLLRSAHVFNRREPSNLKCFSAYPPQDLEIHHDVEKQKFMVCLGTECAVIQYKKVNSTLDLYHTEVPTVFRGQGVAAFLAKGAFEYIRENNLKMKLSCEYLQNYYLKNKNPEWDDLLA